MVLLMTKKNNKKKATSKSFEYWIKMIGRTQVYINTLDTEVVAPLKYLSNFLRSFDLLLADCEIELDLSWSRKCVISKISRTTAVAANPPNPAKKETKKILQHFK